MAHTPPLVCIASSSAPSSSSSSAFFRDASICPDGSTLLASADDRSLSHLSMSTPTALSKRWKYDSADSLVSYDWFPGARHDDPQMFAFTVAVKDHPVTLLDANDPARTRASYPIIDHTERFVAPTAMKFSPDGTALYCGFENAIEIFDVSRPGEPGFTRLKTIPNRRARSTSGQRGLISTLSFSPERTSLFGAGSFNGQIGLYDPLVHDPLVGLLNSTNRAGITKVLFHPTIPYLLFAASRQSDHLELFDLRYLDNDNHHHHHQTTNPIINLERKARTNQRLGFDIDPSGNWLMMGDQNGLLSFFDVNSLVAGPSSRTEPTLTHRISSQPIGACFFHPEFSASSSSSSSSGSFVPTTTGTTSTGMIVTCSGTRTFSSSRRRRTSRRRRPRGRVESVGQDSTTTTTTTTTTSNDGEREGRDEGEETDEDDEEEEEEERENENESLRLFEMAV